jgi:hypothetical protein
MKTSPAWKALSLMIIINFTALSCKSQNDDIKCVKSTDPPVKIEETKIKTPPPEDADYCRACVMARAGFASCQRVWGAKDESREALKQRAIEKACKDAGYTINACPPQAIISNVCKGDPPPPGTMSAGEALKKFAIKRLGGGPAPVEKKAADNKNPQNKKETKKADNPPNNKSIIIK